MIICETYIVSKIIMDEMQQINACIDEMAKLKEKMEALEKQKILNEKNEMLKKTTMRPNLQVLEDWLNYYQEEIEDENEQAKSKIINEIMYLKQKINDKQKNNRDRRYHYQNVDFNKVEKMTLSLETDPYNVLKDKKNKIEQIYQKGNYIKRVTKEESAASLYIEATYNMFNIINKRLDDIEKKLA